jgi:hypothetical protein
MKVTDLRRKLLAALAAGGMLAPSALYAANLNENLIANGGFENVDLATTGSYNAPLILNWTALNVDTRGFAYSHDGSSSNAGAVPNYASGVAPPNSGHWYFTSNKSGGPTPPLERIDQPGEFYQDVDVSTGDSAALIAQGIAGFNLSAYMSTYASDQDIGKVHVDFRNGSGTSLGTATLNDSDAGVGNVWNLSSMTGSVPTGTASVRLSIFGTKVGAGAGADGYIDNVSFLVGYPALAIFVDRANGNITMKNLTGGDVNISNYAITSAFQAMSPANWLSIADNYDAGNPGPNQVDPAHNWSELIDPSAHTDLTEADNESGIGAMLANNKSINLGNGAWIQSHHEDLVFTYISNGEQKNGIIAYLGNSNQPFAKGDFDVDGEINVDDWVILRTNQLANLSSFSLAEAYRRGDLNGDKLSDHADFVEFKTLFDAANGAGAFADMLASVPEPSSVLLLSAAGIFGLSVRRRPSK